MPRANIMYPTCEMAEYARSRLRLLCTAAISADIVSVISPMIAIKSLASGVRMGKIRPTKYTPAATVVADWSNALAGVGASAASASHACSGNCALAAISAHEQADARESQGSGAEFEPAGKDDRMTLARAAQIGPENGQ